jgi:hypothetical protein
MIPSTTHALTREHASRFAQAALGHLRREYPNKLDHVLDEADDLRSPRSLHPIFYGSFDWHSCVHGYWLVLRLYRRFSDLPEARAIREVVDAHFTPEGVAGELAYLARPSSRTFERPYGWGWLLALAAELTEHRSAEGIRWRATLAPLADAFALRFRDHLPRATYPVRAGTHANSAFALALALDYARTRPDPALEEMLARRARDWFSDDRDCQAWEPSGEDFLSPALVEAECMRRALSSSSSLSSAGSSSAYREWLRAFLPRLGEGEPATLFRPAVPSDRSDGKIAHLDGLNFCRAWCFRRIAGALAKDDPARTRLLASAEEHLAISLPHVTGDYMGEHWLATFALLALESAPVAADW